MQPTPIVRRGRKRTARMTPQEIADRFWMQVGKRGPDECWEWQGARDRKGYGTCYPGRRAGSRLSHRLAWTLTNGPATDGMCVCHHCDNPPCCNPAHLFLGTVRDNAVDMIRKGRGWQPRGRDNGNAKLTPDLVTRIFEDLRGNTILAAEIGVSSETVSRVRKVGWGDMRPPNNVVRAHGNAKLTPEQVARIRATETPTNDLARELGVTFQTVWRIRQRLDYWKRVR